MNQYKYFFHVIISLVIIAFISCYKNHLIKIINDDFSLSYPNYFEAFESNDKEILLILKTKKENENDKYIENANITIQNLGDLSFDFHLKELENEIKSIAKLIEKKEITLEEKKYSKFVFKSFERNIELVYVQYLFQKSNMAYILTFSCEAKKYKYYRNDIDKLFLSIKIGSTPQ